MNGAREDEFVLHLLPVREDADIEALQGAHDRGLNVSEDPFLRRVRAKYSVEDMARALQEQPFAVENVHAGAITAGFLGAI